MLSFLLTILILSILIIIHEWGHYIVARKFNVKVNEFSIGLGPQIFSYKGKNCLFSLRLIPLGGYCALEGEDEPSEDIENSLDSKATWQKILIFLAGVTMNFILAFLIIFGVALFSKLPFLEAARRSLVLFGNFFNIIFLSIKMLFTGEAGISDFTGPIGIVSIVDEYSQYGITTILLFMALLSVNLGVFNLLPLPVLDGGQIVMAIFEKIKRKPIKENIKTSLITISFIGLIFLTVIIAYQDILRLL